MSNISIGGGVVSIGDNAFNWCGLTNVMLPASVTSLGTNVFTPCFSLTTISVDSNNPAYASEGGVLFNKDKTTLIQFPPAGVGSYTIPDSVTNIGDMAFLYGSLTNVARGQPEWQALGTELLPALD